MSRRVNFFRPLKPCTDPDVMAFMAATGITDPLIDRALCDFVGSLKAQGLWAKIPAIYPFVGGTATTHKFNLKAPSDTDAGFRLLFSGGWTHDANGATPNGVNAFADTRYVLRYQTTINAHSFGIYSRTENTGGTQGYGCTDGSRFSYHLLSTGVILIGGGAGAALTYSPSPTTGFLMIRSTAIDFREGYRNGVSLGTNTGTSIQPLLPTLPFYLGARNYNSALQLASTHQLSFAFLGGPVALTNTDAVNLSTAVIALQTTLNRNV